MSYKSELRLLWRRLSGQGSWLVIAVLGAITASVLTLVTFDRFRQMVDVVLAGDGSLFIANAKILCLLVPAAVAVEYMLRYSSGRFAEAGTAAIRDQMIVKIQELSMEFLDGRHSGDIMSRLTNDVNLVRDFLANSFTRLFTIPLMAVFALAYMVWVSLPLTLLSVLLIPIMGWVSGRISSAMAKSSRELQQQLGAVNEAARDSLGGILVTKAFNLEDRQNAAFAARVQATVKSSLKLARGRSILSGLASIFNISPFIICLFYGGILVGRGEISAGQLIAFVNFLNYLANPMQQVPRLLGEIQITRAALGRIAEILAGETDRTGGQAFAPGQDPLLEVRNVSFGYGDKLVLDNLSFEIRRGEQVALAGPSGGGKSSILKLIAGFYQPQRGEIRLYGHSLTEWELNALRENMAMVTQDTYLYPGTIAENIGWGKPGSTLEEIIAAAKLANAHDFITALPGAYQSQVGELGAKLSGGQRQRIAIARAILNDADLLLLDEPTSALDAESERSVQQALDSFMAGKTSIIVAHRLSTIKNARRILVIDGGRVVESGSHQELLAKQGVYSKLYQAQLASETEQNLTGQEVGA
ncbi:MAG: ABC transporter ATP-binding protein [Bacillota bacterium]|jgi:ABC-type multidrug transport system fused ATPase/permease subunit